MTSLLALAGAAAAQGARRARTGSTPPSGSIAGTVQHGATLTLTGSGYTSLQWLHDGSPISGETASTYVVDRADGVLDHADITCEMTGPGGTVESNALVYEGADLPLALFSLDYDVTVISGNVDSIDASFGSLALTLTAPAATNRPAYNATGGVGGAHAIMTTDGVDNVLRNLAWTSGVTWSDYELGIVGQRVATSADNDIFIAYYTSGFARYALRDLDAATFKWVVAGGATSVSTTDPDAAPIHFSGSSAGGSQSLRVNGSAEDTDAGTTTSRADGGSAVVGGATDASAAVNCVYHAFYFSRALTADQRTDLRSLLTGLTEVSS